MSQPMTFHEAHELLTHIRQFHSPFSANRTRRFVKYVDPHFDIRTGRCFAIKLRGMAGKKPFTLRTNAENYQSLCMSELLNF